MAVTAFIGNLGVTGFLVLLLIVVVLFGPSKLPMLGESVGKMLRGFKKEMSKLEEDTPKPKNDPASIEGEGRNEIDVTPKDP